MEKIFWAQHEDLDKDSYLFINEERIRDLESSTAEKAIKKILREEVGEREPKRFKNHSTLNEIKFFSDGYVVSGNLISKDNKGRRMTYNCFISKENSAFFKDYVQKVVCELMSKEIHEADLKRVKIILTKKKKDYKYYIIPIVIFIIIFYTLKVTNTI